jgi:hypothetical protein
MCGKVLSIIPGIRKDAEVMDPLIMIQSNITSQVQELSNIRSCTCEVTWPSLLTSIAISTTLICLFCCIYSKYERWWNQRKVNQTIASQARETV